MKASDIAYGDENDAGDKNEGLPIKNETHGNKDNLSKLYTGSDVRTYSEGDYYHSVERFCNTKKNLYLHCIGRKPRFVEENLFKSSTLSPDSPSQVQTNLANYNNFSQHFKNINCSELLYNWIRNCKTYLSKN